MSSQGSAEPGIDHQAGNKRSSLGPVSGIVGVLLGIIWLYYSVQLGLGTPTAPGPGLWPLISGIAFTSVAAISAAVDRNLQPPPRVAVWPVLLGVASLAVYAFLFEHVGMVLPTFAALVFWIRFLGRESWTAALAISSVTTALFWAVFVVLLDLRLPGVLPW